MHIPDGYLSPVFSLGTGVVTVPTWVVGARKLQAVLNNHTIPLLAIFSAFSFTLMMFNIPVPGGTTAHAVGGTMIAIVLGPWAAVIGVSTALIIQALFFGDGGVLAIFTNCMNMAIILPFVGYFSYKLISGRSPILSTRRIWAAGIGSYVGITAAALAVGMELGLQPILFTANGHPLYSPYTFNQTIPAMLLAHMFGASVVDALVTALVLAYLQKNHPEYLTSMRTIVAGADVPVGQRVTRPLWQTFAMGVAVTIALLFIAGLITGGGSLTHLFGADWSQVDWQAVGSMLLVTAIIAVIIIPLAWFLLPRRIKKVGTFFVAIAVIAPLGLIAPGFAYGEGSTADVKAAFGYVPQGMQQLSGLMSAPFSGYNVQFPFFGGANAPLWHAAIGYEICGIIGVLLVGLIILGIGFLVEKRGRSNNQNTSTSVIYSGKAPPMRVTSSYTRKKKESLGWLEHTISGIAGSIERAIFTEENARKQGWLQKVDPRTKLGMFLALILAASLSRSLLILIVLYLVVLGAAYASQLPFDFFVKRVWLGIPFFAGIVIIPSIFLAGAPYLFQILIGPIQLGFSIPGLCNAVVFVARVGVCVSLAVLLVLTTPWADLLKSLQAVYVPHLFILLLSMTYRYIFLFLHSANGLFEARKSRTVGHTHGSEHRRWIGGSMGYLMNRSFKMSNDVYAAMVARGFTGEIRSYSAYRMATTDWIALAVSVGIAVVSIIAGRYV
jgi:cobalt/nickel transport system permease protein